EGGCLQDVVSLSLSLSMQLSLLLAPLRPPHRRCIPLSLQAIVEVGADISEVSADWSPDRGEKRDTRAQGEGCNETGTRTIHVVDVLELRIDRRRRRPRILAAKPRCIGESFA